MAESKYGSVKTEPGPYQAYQSVPSGADSWEKDAKRNFIVKVYSILALQLGFTVLCCGASMYYDPVRHFVVGSGMLAFYGAMISSIVILIALFCNKSTYPLNVYLLSCFTFCESWLVGTICALYQVRRARASARKRECRSSGASQERGFWDMLHRRERDFRGNSMRRRRWSLICLRVLSGSVCVSSLG